MVDTFMVEYHENERGVKIDGTNFPTLSEWIDEEGVSKIGYLIKVFLPVRSKNKDAILMRSPDGGLGMQLTDVEEGTKEDFSALREVVHVGMGVLNSFLGKDYKITWVSKEAE